MELKKKYFCPKEYNENIKYYTREIHVKQKNLEYPRTEQNTTTKFA